MKTVHYPSEDLVMLSTHHLVLKAVTGKYKPRFIGPFGVEE